MLGKTLNEIVAIDRVMNAIAAGTSDQTGSSVDMQAGGGADGVMFIGTVGVLTATQVTQMKAQVSSDDGVGDAFADLAGSQTDAMADTDDNKAVVVDIFQPPERYVRPIFERGTANAVLDGIIAIRYRLAKVATSHGSTVQTSKIVKQAAEGTA